MALPPPRVPPTGSRRRPDFLAPRPPVPALASPEIRRALGLALLLLLLLVFAIVFAGRTPRALDRVFAGAQPASAPARDPSLEARRAERARLLPTLFEGSLLGVVDRTDFSETEKYRRLLELLSAYSPEEVSRRVTGPLPYATALQDPDLVRGDLVRVRGLVFDVEPKRLRSPIHGREDVWRGWLSETDASNAVVFDLLDRPEPFELKRDVVDVEGIFYRVVRYEARSGKFLEVPHLLARSARRADLSRGLSLPPLHLVVVLLLALAAAAAIMFGARRRRGGAPPGRAGFREMFDRRLRESPPPPRPGPPA